MVEPPRLDFCEHRAASIFDVPVIWGEPAQTGAAADPVLRLLGPVLDLDLHEDGVLVLHVVAGAVLARFFPWCGARGHEAVEAYVDVCELG